MSSLADLRNSVRTRYRETTDDLNDLIDGFINDRNKQLSRKFAWKQMLVENATLTLVSGTQQYALPTTFWRFANDTLRYNYLSTTNPGLIISVVSTDDLNMWKIIGQQSRPQVVTVVSASSGSSKRAEFWPAFTDTNITVQYDYYKTATTLVEDEDEPEVEELEEAIVYGTLIDLAAYHEKYELANFYERKFREHRNTAMQTLNP